MKIVTRFCDHLWVSAYLRAGFGRQVVSGRYRRCVDQRNLTAPIVHRFVS